MSSVSTKIKKLKVKCVECDAVFDMDGHICRCPNCDQVFSAVPYYDKK